MIAVPSVCFPRIPAETTESEIAQLFEDVHHIDMVQMEDENGEFQMAFVHFNEPEKMRRFVEYIHSCTAYTNGWLVKPNYKPVKRSTRKWSPEELVEIEQYFREKEANM
jgi:hypothetical protein